MTINQLIDNVLDEFEIHKPYKDFDLPLGEAVAKKSEHCPRHYLKRD